MSRSVMVPLDISFLGFGGSAGVISRAPARAQVFLIDRLDLVLFSRPVRFFCANPPALVPRVSDCVLDPNLSVCCLALRTRR
jgi:hypothetical protein